MHVDEAGADMCMRARFRIRASDAAKARYDVGDRSRSPISSHTRCGIIECTVSTCRRRNRPSNPTPAFEARYVAHDDDLPARETIAIAVPTAASRVTAGLRTS
ncbi:hypothetical protein [Burkholderia oklahomensis]|uniref:hypothetical protein n=1 Tax=Burkholderia oklahomensis TaxID=342113 RepID=UPI00016A3CF7|nr:hypothetical protein [Burkholderia oklahomensis]QPS39832.1 hypothetical protein I6G57_28915 [Burkholderia oklahomensis]